MRIAFIHDWLLTWRGGEKCLGDIIFEFQESEVYTLFVNKSLVDEKLPGITIYSSFLSCFPLVRHYYRFLLPLYPLGIWHLSFILKRNHQKNNYQRIVSISHCAAKNITAPNNVPHVCYCLTPVRYLWDQYDIYFKDKWYEFLTKLIRVPFQSWDKFGARNVEKFIAISNFISKRIRKYYDKDSIVVYPPVDVGRFINLKDLSNSNKPYYLMISALVPYKNVELVVKVCVEKNIHLKIIGDGPQRKFLQSIAGAGVEILGWVSDQELERILSGSKALIHLAVEDFGISPVEAQAAGKPVIVLNQGGCLETGYFYNKEEENQPITAVEIKEQTSSSLLEAINKFEELYEKGYFSAQSCRESAQRFSVENFKNKLKKEIIEC